MKKIYQKPSIKVRNVETESPLAISVGGNTGIGLGDPSDNPGGLPNPTAKGYNFFGTDAEPSTSSSIWDEE